jgi:hypothetical protein
MTQQGRKDYEEQIIKHCRTELSVYMDLMEQSAAEAGLERVKPEYVSSHYVWLALHQVGGLRPPQIAATELAKEKNRTVAEIRREDLDFGGRRSNVDIRIREVAEKVVGSNFACWRRTFGKGKKNT